MPIRATHVQQGNTTGETTDPIPFETTYDGQTFNWAPGENRAFGDDGQGAGHIANSGAGTPAAGVVEDNELSKKRNPNSSSRS